MSEEVASAINTMFVCSEFEALVDSIADSFQHGGENGDQNLVGVIDDLARNVKKIASAITPLDAAAGKDATGGTVASLTEAVMGVTGGLVQIANAIQSLAEAVNQNCT